MNKKGFTLIELLAVIVILGIIMVVAVPSVTSAFKNSKLKNEEIFVKKISGVIDDYVALYSNDITFTGSFSADKKEEGRKYSISVKSGEITVQDILNSNLISKNNLINPGNKEAKCNENAIIEIYRDSEYVYCHKISKEKLGCLSEEYKKSIEGDYVIDTCVWEKAQ